MKNNRLLLSLIFIFLPFIYLAAIYGGLPDEVPTHFDRFGQPDGWSPKWVLWLLPGIGIPLMLAVNKAIMRGLPAERVTDKHRNISLLILGFTSAILCYIIYGAEAGSYNGIGGVAILLGLFFAALGNYMPVLPRNNMAGIRVPPTLKSERKWRRTHRFAGPLFLIGGLALVIGGIFLRGTALTFLLIGTSVVINLIPAIYAYRLPDEEEGEFV